MIKHALLAGAICSFAATSSVAFARNDVVFSQDKSTAFVPRHATARFTPNYTRKAKDATIYSNLASAYPKGLYFGGEGSTLYFSPSGSQFVAAGFTPTANATAVEIQAAVGNFSDGKDSFVVSIYSDAGGVPGKALSSTVATANTAFGDCCGLMTAKIKGGLALTGGTPYWVAITENAKQQKAQDDGAWNLATTDQVDPAPFAFNANGNGWVSSPTTLPPAFAVYSK